MSGPKTSSYTLTAEQRRALMERRRRQLELERAEQARSFARDALARADKALARVKASACPESEELSSLVGGLEEARAELSAAVARASAADAAPSTDHVREIRMRVQGATDQVELLAEKAAEAVAAAENAYRSDLFEGLAVSAGQTSRSLRTRVSPGKIEKQDQSAAIDHLRASMLADMEDLSDLLLDDSMRSSLSEMVGRVSSMEDVAFLRNYRTVTLKPFSEKCHAAHRERAAAWRKYSDLISEYELCAKDLGIDVPSAPFDLESIEALEREVAQMRDAAIRSAEMDYVGQCIDEVMEEMGYAVLGSRCVEKKGRAIRNELFEFDEGAAVSITRSDDGMVTMELGGLDTVDRVPSDEERMELASLMEDFCDDYAEIERRLKDRGVESVRMSILPPDEDYAQIINIRDFGLNETTTLFEDREKRRTTHRSSTTKVRGL